MLQNQPQLIEPDTWLADIKPTDKKMRLNLKEIWRYRDLVSLFVRRDFAAQYKQTIIGPAWAVIQPLLTTVVFSIIFGSLAKLTTSDVPGVELKTPAFLFYMTGTVFWAYFSKTVSATSSTFIENAKIMSKVYYPRMVTPISTSLSNLISYLIQLVLFIILLVIFVLIGSAEVTFSWLIFLVPVLILQMMMLAAGVGILVSAFTTKYRDLKMLVGFGLQLWEYFSPIPYGLSLVPEHLLWIYMLNPVTPIITTMRCAFFGVGYFNIVYYLISLAFTAVIFIFGMVMFNRTERTFADTV